MRAWTLPQQTPHAGGLPIHRNAVVETHAAVNIFADLEEFKAAARPRRLRERPETILLTSSAQRTGDISRPAGNGMVAA